MGSGIKTKVYREFLEMVASEIYLEIFMPVTKDKLNVLFPMWIKLEVKKCKQ